MKKNIGTIDRTVRILAGALIAILYFTDQISGIAAIILGIISLAFIITSFMGWYPAYVPFKLSTTKKSD
jgi:hypothetical protein